MAWTIHVKVKGSLEKELQPEWKSGVSIEIEQQQQEFHKVVNEV